MLVLTRKLNQAIVIDGDITVRVVGVSGDKVRLGIEADDSVKVYREEIQAEIDAQSEARER